MLTHYYKYRRVITRFRSGALGNEMDNIAADLSRLGYKSTSIKLYLARIARFSGYAMDQGYNKSSPIPRKVVDCYLDNIPTSPARWASQSAIRHAQRCFPDRFLTTPRQNEVVPDGPLLAAYLKHLQTIRGLQPKTCEGLLLAARRILAWQKMHLDNGPLSGLTPIHVLAMTHDLLVECRSDVSRSSATSCIRSFLRYLSWTNLNAQELAQFVPKTAYWHHAHLPPQLAWESIRYAVDAIDLTTASGLRDRAIILLFATTGMRSKELRQLELDDIHWRAGELVLRQTKGHRNRAVPLLEETAAALAEYVLQARPRIADRRIFLSLVPPIRPLIHSGTLSRIVLTRLQRAGIPIQRGGAHLLRHSLATRLVQKRRPIKEVADLLGHQSIDTTSIYVKVAVTQLTDVPLPFPGGKS